LGSALDTQDRVVEQGAIGRAIFALFGELAEALRDEDIGVCPREWLGRFERQSLIGNPGNNLVF
jgi:hypothetical protein